MENGAFEKTQRYLTQLLGYLEGIHASMDWESAGGIKTADSSHFSNRLSTRIGGILSQSGNLEGLHLKARGCLSTDLVEFIRTVSMAFEIDAEPIGSFKLPFLNSTIRLQKKTLNDFMENAWLIYHQALLSAYALKSVGFEILAPENSLKNPLEKTLSLVEINQQGPDDIGWEGVSKDAVHGLNNLLSGILGYTSLILEERQNDMTLQERLKLIRDATEQACALLAKPAT